jgi:electron transfer flavoprotein beta subunit
MKIAVCIKQVPTASKVKIDPDTGTLIRSGFESAINPFDSYALEAGLMLKEKYNCSLTVISMGPVSAKRILFDALSLGADRAVLLNDRKFAGSDTWATSYILSEAIKKLGDVSLVICGRQAIDGDTSQTGPGIAAHLGWMQAACVSGISELPGQPAENIILTADRFHETGYDKLLVKFPAVITVLKDISSPRLPTLKGKLDARSKAIEIWDASYLEIPDGMTGLAGSPTRVVKTFQPPPRKAKTLLIEGDTLESSEKLLSILASKLSSYPAGQHGADEK